MCREGRPCGGPVQALPCFIGEGAGPNACGARNVATPSAAWRAAIRPNYYEKPNEFDGKYGCIKSWHGHFDGDPGPPSGEAVQLDLSVEY